MMLPIDHIDSIAGEHFDGKIDGHFAYFYGICGACAAKNNYKSVEVSA